MSILWRGRIDEIAALRSEIRQLSKIVGRLAETQRKEALNAKKLRAAFAAHEASWERALAHEGETIRAEFERVLDKQQAANVRWQRTFDTLDRRMKAELKWRTIFATQLSAIIRRLWLPLDRVRPPYNLSARRFRLRSQHEEDGILLTLLDRAGSTQCRFVEIGSGASGGNAAILAYDLGWSGLMVDASPTAIEKARRRFAGNPGVSIVHGRVTPMNVNALLEQHGFNGEVDLLSIDIDSYDYWILEALSACSPRVLILEYNALFGSEQSVTIPLDQSMADAPKGYSGASLTALARLAARKGYRLVGCEDSGVNAFFLRNDVAADVPEVPAAVAWRPLRSRVADEEVSIDIFEVSRSRALPLIEV